MDVLTAADAGMIERSDEDHLEYATARDRIVCTSNQGDFYRIHTQWLTAGRSHAGIICAPQQRYSVGEQMRRLLRLAAAHSTESMRDRMEFLSAWG